MILPKRTQPVRSATRKAKAPARQREHEVYTVAAKLFNERGYATTSVENVADALGILKGSLYYYIDSKEDLLFKIVSEVHEDSREIFESTLGRTDLPPLQRLALFVRKQARYNAANVERVVVYYHDVDQLSAERRMKIRTCQKAHFRALVELIVTAQEGGLIDKRFSPALAARGVLSTIIWRHTWFRPGGKVMPDELAEFCVGYVLGGLEKFNPRADDGPSPRTVSYGRRCRSGVDAESLTLRTRVRDTLDGPASQQGGRGRRRSRLRQGPDMSGSNGPASIDTVAGSPVGHDRRPRRSENS